MKLKKLLDESNIELGKVYTDRDRPPFKTDEQINEATVENESNLNFKIAGILKNDLIIEGKKMKLTLSFKGDDLKDAVNGKSKGGKVVFASVKIK